MQTYDNILNMIYDSMTKNHKTNNLKIDVNSIEKKLAIVEKKGQDTSKCRKILKKIKDQSE